MIQEFCPECGRPIEPNKPCPSCLMNMVSQPTDALDIDLSEIAPDDVSQQHKANAQPHVPPDIDMVRAAFPQLEILECVGHGGMGTVFKARQPSLDRFVALKILSENLAAKPTFAERFAQEGKLLARLSHPNIVGVYDFGQAEVDDKKLFFLILEFVEGVNLRQAMREERFSPEQALAIVPKICEALQYAHDEGVLHRDIKPENILLDTKGRIKIADFGIGKLVQTINQSRDSHGAALLATELVPCNESQQTDLTQQGLVLGTPSYMAPEQREMPGSVDHRADIYSLGVVFYELLTGELPKGDFPVPSEKTPVGAEVDEIVQKALQHERDKRYQSAADMKTHIETVTMLHTPSEMPTPENVKSPKRRNYAGWGCGLMVVWFVVFCMTASFWLTARSVSVQGDVVIGSDANGNVISMTPEEPRGPSTFALVVGFGLLAAMIGLPILMTWLGWKHLRQIRTTDNKSGWLLGMFTTLFCPFFLLWLVLWAVMLILFSSQFVGTPFNRGMEALGGMFGTFFAMLIAIAITWKTYHWIFPKPVSPARLAHWGLGLEVLAATLVLLTILITGIFPMSIAKTQYHERLRIETSHRTQWQQLQTQIEQLKETPDSRSHDAQWWQKQEDFRRQSERWTRELAEQKSQQIGQLSQAHGKVRLWIQACLLVPLWTSAILAIVGSIFGWCHLAKIRRSSEKPGRVLGLITALLPVSLAMIILPAAILGVIFSLGDFGRNRDFATAVAALCGGVIGLIAAIFVIWRTCRWQGKQSTINMEPLIETAAMEQAHEEQTPQASGSRGPWLALFISIVAVVMLFVSAYFANGFYIPKWTQEGRLDLIDQKIRQLERHVENGGSNIYLYSSNGNPPATESEELKKQKLEYYQHWLNMFKEKKETEESNFVSWKQENSKTIIWRTWSVPLVVAFVLSVCGYYVFRRIKSGNVHGIIPLIFVFAIFMFFTPLSLQYVGCSWWSGDPGYWDDTNGDILGVLFLLTFLVFLPILIQFFRRSISLTKNRSGQSLPASRAKLALGITLASIVISLVAFGFVGIAGITHELRYRCLREGEIAFMKDNIAMRNEFVAGYKAIKDSIDKKIDNSSGDSKPEMATGIDWYDVDLSNELSWFTSGWEGRVENFDLFYEPRRTRSDEIVKMIIVLWGLSFMFAIPSGTVGTFLGLGYLRKNRGHADKKMRNYASISVGALPLMAALVMIVGGISWFAMSPPSNDTGGFVAAIAMIYLLVVSVIFGFIAVISNTSKP